MSHRWTVSKEPSYTCLVKARANNRIRASNGRSGSHVTVTLASSLLDVIRIEVNVVFTQERHRPVELTMKQGGFLTLTS